MIALDTTALIDLWKHDEKLRAVIGSLNDRLCTTSINYQELLFGLDLKRPKHREELQFYRNLIQNLVLLPHTQSAVENTGRLWSSLKTSGRAIGEFDTMVVGILRANRVSTILTRNVKHFKLVPRLRVETY